MLTTFLLMAPLIALALMAQFTRRPGRAVLAYSLFAVLMVPVWWLFQLPWVGLAQLFLAAGLTSLLLWRALQDKVATE